MMAVGNGWSWYVDSLVLARRMSIGTARKVSQVCNVMCTMSSLSCSPQPQTLATLMPAIFLTPFMIHGDFSLWYARAQCAR